LLKQAAFVADSTAPAIWCDREYATRQFVAARRAQLSKHGRRPAFVAGSFHKVCAVNTVYFWPSLDSGIAQVKRVLAPAVRVAIGILPKTRWIALGYPADIFRSRSEERFVRRFGRTVL